MNRKKRIVRLSATAAALLMLTLSPASAEGVLSADFFRDPALILRVSHAVRTAEETDTETPWYESEAGDLVAHALGRAGRIAETNTCEAFLQSYRAGYRIFEADFMLTSDSQLILRHDFDRNSYVKLGQRMDKEHPVMSLSQFLSTPVKNDYTPLDVNGLVELLVKYNDARLITDTKFTDTASITQEFERLCAAVDAAGDPSVYDRIIVQIYNDDMLKTVRDIHEFSHWIYTLYQQPDRDMERIGRFCEHNGIDVVTMSSEIFSKTSVETLHRHGLRVYFHTVNDADEAQKLRKGGADGFYTDDLLPEKP